MKKQLFLKNATPIATLTISNMQGDFALINNLRTPILASGYFSVRTLVICFGLFLLSSISFGQQQVIDELFEKYSGREGFTVVEMGNGMLTLASLFEKDDPETKELLKQIDGIRIITSDDNENAGEVDFYQEVMGKLNTNGFKELMTVKEKDQNVKFWAREENGVITEILLLAGGKDNTLISIRGKIDPSNAGKVAKEIEIH